MKDELGHDVEIIGNRKYDNSLIYKCLKCERVGIYLSLIRCERKSSTAGRHTTRSKIK